MITKVLAIDFQDEKDYTDFLDGMTLTDREYLELDKEIK